MGGAGDRVAVDIQPEAHQVLENRNMRWFPLQLFYEIQTDFLVSDYFMKFRDTLLLQLARSVKIFSALDAVRLLLNLVHFSTVY